MTAATTELLRLRGLHITSHEGSRTIVSGLDLDVRPGETVGIVGESGSGKSMTARAIVGLLPAGVHATGSVTYRGRELLDLPPRALNRIRGSELGLLFQDPFTTLNPLMRAGKQVIESWPGRRASRQVRREEALRRLAEVGITDPDVADRFPFQLSGGMRQRVGLAAALAGDPQVLVADEPTTALDVTTQAEILELLKSIQTARGMGLVLITHDLSVAFSVCDRVVVLYAGSVLESAPAEAIADEPLHPYTLGLLLSEPSVRHRRGTLVTIPGSVPSFDEVADQCAFAPRCEWTETACTSGRPAMARIEPERDSACVRVHDIRAELGSRRRADRPTALAATPPIAVAPLVRVKELVKVFPGSRTGGDVQALRGVSVEVGENESVGLVGESGSGKTTLARCLLGLETCTAGHVEVDGVDAGRLATLPASDRRRLRKTIQIVFQDPYSSLNPARTVGATLREALDIVGRGTGSRRDGVHELLSRVGLPASYAGRKPVALSGGERQRVAIARALAVRPRVLVCDEPVSALDVSVQAQILNLFAELRTELGISYLFITHDLAVVRQVVDRVYVLYRGEVVESGPVGEVLDQPRHSYTARLVASAPQGADARTSQDRGDRPHV